MDPYEREAALELIQDYLPMPGSQTPREIDNAARWRKTIARKEVQQAIHKVGRVERYHLEQPKTN
jgi:hypothetical protein